MARLKRDSRGYFNTTIRVGTNEHGARVRRRIRSKTLAGLREKELAARSAQAQKIAPGAKPTLAAFLPEWLETDVRRHCRQRTYERYEMDVRNHLIPRLGRYRVDRLSTYDVQQMVNQLADTGAAPRTVRNIYAALRKALATAVAWKLVSENVALGVKLPKAERPLIVVLTVAQARLFLDTLKGARLEALYWVALMLGLRQGELLALRWSDIDLEKRTITISRAVQRHKLPEGSRLVYVPPKTDQGTRILPLLAPLDVVLINHLHRQDTERLAAGWEENDLVFPNTRGRPYEKSNLVYKSFRPALARAGLPQINFHALRHTAVSLLLSYGADPNTAAYIAGHASAGFTVSVYGHAMPEPVQAAVGRLGDLLGDQVLELPVMRPSGDTAGDTTR